MAGYSPAGSIDSWSVSDYCRDYYWDRFFYTLDWLKNEADDETYWNYWRSVNGWPVPKRPQDSWLDRLKHRNTFWGRIAADLFGN